MTEATDTILAPIPNYPGYFATLSGNIIGKRGKILTGCVDRCGYREVILSSRSVGKRYLVHRLILSSFNPHPDMSELDVNHIDGNKLNNALYNLEWCTRSQNIKHSYRNGLQKIVTNPKGTFKVLTPSDVQFIAYLHCNGLIDRKIAEILRCSRSLVSRKIRELKLR